MGKKIEKILYILPRQDYFSNGVSGRTIHALGLANGFAASNISVTIFSESGINYFINSINQSIKLIAMPKIMFMPMVISEIIWKNNLYRTIKRFNRDCKQDATIIRYAVKNQLLHILFSLGLRKTTKVIVEVNSLAYHQLSDMYNGRTIPKIVRNIIIRLEIVILNLFDCVYVVSKPIKDDLIRYGLKCKIIVIPNGSDKYCSIKKQYSKVLSNSPERIIYYGRLQKHYDFTLLCEAFNVVRMKVHSIKLHIFGKGSLYAEIFGKYGNSDDILFHGSFSPEYQKEFLNPNTDILILPLRPGPIARIGSPTKLFDYMAHGLPIIASNFGQVKDIISHKHNGYLYDPEDQLSLENIMNYVIKRKKERVNVGKVCQQEFFKFHTWERRALKLVNSIASNNSRKLRV